METIRFVYLGEDFEYLKEIESSLKNFYKELGIQIDKKSLKTMKEARDFIHSKETQKYSLFIVDFSAHFPIYIFTAQVLGFMNNYKIIPMLGLAGIENTEDQFLSGVLAGCKGIFVKGIEVSATVNFAIQLYNPKAVRPISWPSGEFAEDEVDCFACFKLCYFTNKYLHVETNLSIPLNEEIIVRNKIADNIGAEKFKVVREPTTNFYYNLNHNYDLEILAPSKRIDPNLGLINPEKKEPPGVVEGKALELFKQFIEKLSKWIDSNIKNSKPKRTKVLIVDQELSILTQMDKNPEDYPFFIMAHRNFLPEMTSIKKSKASFIVLVLDKPNEEEETKIINTIELLPKIIQISQLLEGYSPFIFIFNCDLSQNELQKKFNYPKIITYQGPFDFNIFLKIVEKFESTGSRKLTHDPAKSAGDREKRFYISKNAKESFGFHPFKIRITGINETTMDFKTTYILDDFFVLKLEFPSKMWLTVLPKPKGFKKEEGYLKTYTAAIHGIGELEKNQLRVYINKVFVPKEEPPKKAPQKKAS